MINDLVPAEMRLDALRTAGSSEENAGPQGIRANPGFSYNTCKRLIDLAGSIVLIIAAAPLMLAVAVIIKLTSPGPVFFKQRRPGLFGREFMCWKFRTMVIDAEKQLAQNESLRAKFEENFKLIDDPRLTCVGSFLRRTSLDELPQLFNVLSGSMSLIGPRPILPSQLAKYRDNAEKLLSVKPGLGGLWQVYGRSGTCHEVRVELDIAYIDRRSIVFDVKLIILTAWVVLRQKGAY